MTQVTAEQALVFPDEVSLEEGTALTDELLMQALPLESFISVSAGRGAPECTGAAASDRRSGWAHLGRRAALRSARTGGAQTGARTSRCRWATCLPTRACSGAASRRTPRRGGWQPDKTPPSGTKWRSSPKERFASGQRELTTLRETRLHTPDAEGKLYVCQQAHTSQAGWEPPSVPALWSPANGSRQENPPVAEMGV